MTSDKILYLILFTICCSDHFDVISRKSHTNPHHGDASWNIESSRNTSKFQFNGRSAEQRDFSQIYFDCFSSCRIFASDNERRLTTTIVAFEDFYRLFFSSSALLTEKREECEFILFHFHFSLLCLMSPSSPPSFNLFSLLLLLHHRPPPPPRDSPALSSSCLHSHSVFSSSSFLGEIKVKWRKDVRGWKKFDEGWGERKLERIHKTQQ